MKTKERIIMLLHKYRDIHTQTETSLPALITKQTDLDDFLHSPPEMGLV